MKRKTDSSPETSGDMLAVWARMQRDGLRTWSLMGAAMAESAGEIGGELSEFLARRLGEDIKLQHALMHAKDLDEVRRLQQAFLEQAMEDYRAETGRLIDRVGFSLPEAPKTGQ